MDKIKKLQDIRRIIVSLDLTHMDDLLIQYARFLTNCIDGEKEIILYHNIRFDYPDEAEKIFQSLDQPLAGILRKKIEQKAVNYLGKNAFSIIVEENDDTAIAISDLQGRTKADLILFGKKVSYDGSGYLIERVVYQKVHSNIMILPETAFHRISRVLVPIDFSKQSARALYYGIDLSNSLDAEIICQYVYAVPNIYFPYVPVKDLKQEMIASSEKRWKAFTNKYLKGITPPKIDFSFHADRTISQMISDYSVINQMDIMVLPLEVGFTHNTVIQLLKTNMNIPIYIVK